MVSIWLCAVSDSPSDLLKSWGGECDGHMHGNSAGLVGWATVYLIVITDVKCSAAKPKGQF